MSESSTTSDLTLAGLVHDLNNVFETISEAAELMSEDEEWAGVAGAIQRSVARGRRIVGGYADRSRSGPELDEVVDRAATFLSDFLRHVPGAKVKVHKRLSAGLRLPGEASDWERVFMNLFLNAAQAMKERGEGSIEVESELRDAMLELRVSDDGPGIPEGILGKIFKPRFSTRTQQTGLGLHIVHTIVTQCGGSVTAENRPDGRGAVFTILAPAGPQE